jgi:PAS domain S-box-containing protein
MADRFGDLVASARDILATLDQSGSFTYVSPAIQHALGLIPNEIVGNVIWELVHPRDVAAVYQIVNRVLAEGGRDTLAFQMRDVNGGWHDLDATVQFLEGDEPTVSLAATDVTELRRLTALVQDRDEQLRQAQKLEVLGRLVSGISHDFGNLLTIIIGESQRLIEALAPESPLHSHAESIRVSADRAASLVRQLLSFVRQGGDAPTTLALNELVAKAEQMVVRLVGEHITVATVYGDNLWPVKADRTRIEQVLLNLAVNARDAMPQGGTLTIETRNAPEGEDNPIGRGEFVVVSVTDTGIGMDEATRARAFEPFFTTKPIGKGTGIGLATVQEIVRDAGGWTTLTSRVGQGTTVAFGLPRTAAESRPSLAAKNEARGGSETLLLVEDEEGVRELVRDMLTLAGYDVLEAAMPSDAERISRTHAGLIHLLVTDVVLPELSGLELSERLRAHRPDLQVMFMSGFPEPALRGDVIEAPGTYFISKPFNRQGLLECVRRALDAAAAQHR